MNETEIHGREFSPVKYSLELLSTYKCRNDLFSSLVGGESIPRDKILSLSLNLNIKYYVIWIKVLKSKSEDEQNMTFKRDIAKYWQKCCFARAVSDTILVIGSPVRGDE